MIGKVRAGDVAKADGTQVLDVLKARMEALTKPVQDAEGTPPAEPETASPAAAGLDPDDPWALKVEELSSQDEATAALDEVTDLLASGEIDGEHFKAVESAILARFPAAGGEGQVAA